jgi:hypothetical protein
MSVTNGSPIGLLLSLTYGEIDAIDSHPMSTSVRIYPTYDGYIWGDNSNYFAARATGEYENSSNLYLRVGTEVPYAGGVHSVYRAALKFDTSIIPENATIEQVNLDLTCSTISSTASFDIDVVKYDWSDYDPISSTSIDAVYDGILDGTKDATWQNTDDIVEDVTYSSQNLDPSHIESTGYTYYGLRSSRDRGFIYIPTGNERVSIHSAENTSSASFRPSLLIRYSTNISYTCNFMWGSTDYVTTFNEADRLVRYTIDRGREEVFGKGINTYDIGTLRMTLDNFDGRYDPWNTASPIYGDIKPGVKMTFGTYKSSTDTYKSLFTGLLQDVKVNGYNNEVTFICEDGWRWLRDQEYGKYMTSTNANIGDILEEAFDSSYPWDLDVSSSTSVPNFVFVPTGSCKSLVEEVAYGTLGRAWVDTEGDLNFKTVRETTDASVKTIQDDYILRDIRIASPWDNYRSKVIFNGYQAAPDDTWEDNDKSFVAIRDYSYDPITIAPGESYGELLPIVNNYVNPFPSATLNITGSTDYTYVVNEVTMDYYDYTLTNNSLVDSITDHKIEAYNIGAYNYMYGTKAWEYETTDADMVDNDITVTSFLFNVKAESTGNPSTSDETLIDDMGNTLLNYLGTVRPYPVIAYRGRYDEQFDMDLEDKVTLDLSQLGINGDYRVSKISHASIMTPQDVQTTLWLYPSMELST